MPRYIVLLIQHYSLLTTISVWCVTLMVLILEHTSHQWGKHGLKWRDRVERSLTMTSGSLLLLQCLKNGTFTLVPSIPIKHQLKSLPNSIPMMLYLHVIANLPSYKPRHLLPHGTCTHIQVSYAQNQFVASQVTLLTSALTWWWNGRSIPGLVEEKGETYWQSIITTTTICKYCHNPSAFTSHP